MPAGRPPLYNNCIDFDAMCELYFEECDNNILTIDGAEVVYPEPYLKSGLALFLGITTNTLLVWSKDQNSEFYSIIKRNYDKIQNDLEKRSIMNGKQATGCIFNLKCNFGMVETSKIDMVADIGIEAKIRAQVESELLDKNMEQSGTSSHAERILKKQS